VLRLRQRPTGPDLGRARDVWVPRHAAPRGVKLTRSWRIALPICVVAVMMVGGVAAASSFDRSNNYKVTVQALGIDPTSPTVGQTVTAVAKVAAEHPQKFDLVVLVVRDQDGGNYDFPSAQNWSVGGSRQKEFTASRAFDKPGTYTYWLAFRKAGTWTNLDPKKMFTVVGESGLDGPGPLPAASLSASPAPAGQSPSPTTAGPSPSPSTKPSSSPSASATTPAPVGKGFPTASNTGVPAGWVPAQTVAQLVVTTPGAVVENVRVNGEVLVRAANVTLRNIEVIGGGINNAETAPCKNGLLIENVSILKGSNDDNGPRVYAGGYTARRVKIEGPPEGFRVGERQTPYNCGPVVIEDSYVHIVRPDVCLDWHGDGVQGYNGGALTMRNTSIDFQDTTPERGFCDGTSAVFYPGGQGNTGPLTVDRLLVRGGGFAFRTGMHGTVTGLRVAPGHNYGPVDVVCSLISQWEAKMVDSFSAYPNEGADIPCSAA
jgi:hypothetical protein